MRIFIDILREVAFYTSVAPMLGIVVCWKLKRRKLFILRLIPAICIALLFNVNFLKCFGIEISGLLTYYIWPHLLLFALCFFATWFCYDINVITALFLQSLAFVLIHLLTNISDTVLYLLGMSRADVTAVIVLFIVSVIFVAATYLFISRQIVRYNNLYEYKSVLLVFCVVNVSFSVVLSQLVFANTLGSLIVYILRIILCLCFIILPFIIFALSESRAEKNMYEQMMIQSEKYRKQSKENIEAINIKYHDLKYRLAALKEGDLDEERGNLISDLERDMNIYGVHADTGNSTVDMLLTEKGLICNNNKIHLLCNVDASGLDFIHKGDLYALLGNALDNAIEAVCDVDEEHRIISFNIIKRGNVINISVENYCRAAPHMVNGLPQTTKNDKRFHGYGVRSMRMIVEKYGGEIYIECTEHSFLLNIFFAKKITG